MGHRHTSRDSRIKSPETKDQLPKFLYDQIPTVTNKSVLNSRLSYSSDSPYSSIMMKTRVASPSSSSATKGSAGKSPKGVRNGSSSSSISNQSVSPKVSRDIVRKRLTLDTSAINNSPSTVSSIPVKIPNNNSSSNNNNSSTSYNKAQLSSSSMQPEHRRLSTELPIKVPDFRKTSGDKVPDFRRSVLVDDKEYRRINSEKLPDFRRFSVASDRRSSVASDRRSSAASDRRSSGGDRKTSANSFLSDYRRRSSTETSSPAKIPDHRISSGEGSSSTTAYNLDIPTSRKSSGNSPLYDLGEKYFSILGHAETPVSKSPDSNQQATTTAKQQSESSQIPSQLQLPEQMFNDTLAVVPEDKSLESVPPPSLKDEFSFEIHPVKKPQVHFTSSATTPSSSDLQLGSATTSAPTSATTATSTLKDEEKGDDEPGESWKDEWKEADDEDEEEGLDIAALELNSSKKRINRGLHSNSSSVSWSPNNSEEWTIDNVISWLKLNDFNDTWIKGFENMKLEKDKFLKLQSYQEIKRFSTDFDTTDAYSTPTRFVQLLRRALGRTHSSSVNIQETPIMNSSPISLISESSTLESFGHEDEYLEHLPITLDPRSMPKDKSRSVISEGNILLTADDGQYGEKLVPVVSAPVASNDDVSSISSLKKIEIERKPAGKPRPFSSFERTSYSHNPYPPNSKTFFRKHDKSNSSDSSIMASLSNNNNNNNIVAPAFPLSSDNSSSGYTSPYSAKGNYHTRTASKGSVSDNNTPKQGIFNKFFGKNKVVDLPAPPRSLDMEESPVSPSSSLNENNKRAKKSPFDTEKKRISAIFSTDHYYSNNSEKKKKEKEEHLRKTTMKNIPRFEKIGPVGKRPSPTGVTIPVITTSTLPSTPLPNNDQLNSTTPNLKPNNFQVASKIKAKPRLPSFTLDKKFRPVSKKSNSDIFILVTSDNTSFKPVNIANFKTSAELKDHLIEILELSKEKETIFRLTDFGCDPGEELDEETFDGIHECKFFHGMGKLLLFQKKDESPRPNQSNELQVPSSELTSIRTNSSYANSTTSEQSYEKYLTPQHMVENSKLKEGTDYLNFKETFETIQEKPGPYRHQQQQPVYNTSPPRRTPSMSLGRTSSLTRARSITTSNSSIDGSIKSSTNFRVIRSEKREIDFDKRRSSPFIKQEFGGNLVALRSAPPPPSNNNSTESLGSGKSLKSRKPPPAGVLGTSAAAEMDENLTRHDSLKRYISITRKSTIKRRPTNASSKRRSFDPFRENEIVFNKPDEESDDSDEDDSDDSDDGLFAKVPKASPQNTNSSAADTSIQASLLSSSRDNRTVKSADNDKDTDTFLSSSTESSLDIRPPPEVVLDHLEVYFPNTDLDKLIINEVVTPPVSPIAESPVGSVAPAIESKKQHRPSSSLASSIKSKGNLAVPENSSGRMHRMKSIRIVAQEAKRKAEREQKSMGGSLLRRKSTKMWGQRVVEVKPGSATSKYVNKLRDQQGKYKEFAWVKGELIGSGSFGKVYLALNVTTGDMIAVKQIIISSRFLNNKETKEKVDTFKAEVDSLKDLDHENIVQYLGFEMKGGTYSIFLEYVSGGSVGHLIRIYGKFSEKLASNLTEQVLEGLSYIHSKGILHRDLKADNLLLETNGVCKISDFGISKKSKDIYTNDSTMSFQGTIFWMAPELVDNSGYNAKVDIWSLGCVVFEMFSGKRPWHDFAYAGALFKLGNKCAPPIPEETKKELSAKSTAFLDRCFSVDPDKRPTASELVTDAFCERDPSFKFEETDLGKKMRFNDKLSERKAEMILKSREG